MLRFINKTDLHYPIGDTFIMHITSDETFAVGSTLDFIVARNDKSEDIISQTFRLTDNSFTVELSSADKKKLSVGDEYVYKLVLKGADGSIFTQMSGILRVEWGA